MMDPAVLEDTIHEMASSLTRLNLDSSSKGSHESSTPRSLTAPTGELRSVFTTTTPNNITAAHAASSNPPYFSAFRPAPLFSQYSASPPSSPDSDAVIPWPALDGESTYIRPSQEFLQRRPSTRCSMQHPGRRLSIASSRHTRSSSSVSAASYMLGTSPFPAPSKPLPPVPASVRSSQSTSQRASSQRSWTDKSSVDMDRYSQSSGTTSSNPSRSSFQSLRIRPPIPPRPPEHLRPDMPSNTAGQCPLEVVYWKHLWGAEKRKAGKTNMVLYLDVSSPGATVATKHGNAIIKFWNVSTGQLKNTIKISAYTEAHSRGREYLIRSHTILSEANQLAAIATRFGRSVEIWSFADKPKKLQLIDDADRWVAGRFESYDSGWSALAAYRGKEALIDLYAATTRDKKPFAKVRTIDVRKAGLPFLPQYPELAICPTSHILAIAAGPRTPRAGHPPPDRETLLVTWDISDYRDVTNQPHRVVRPWQHRELETAIPCTLVACGDLIMSIWIPAGYRTVSTKNASGNTEYTLTPTPVPFRYVLVWDLSENSTRTYGIPNTVSCISPDCRFVAYCNVAERRTKLAILDAQSGDELWTVGGEGNLKSLEQVGDLAKVTELAFSQDGRFLMVGDIEGNTSVYDVRASMI